jgi:hypothetical protein
LNKICINPVEGAVHSRLDFPWNRINSLSPSNEYPAFFCIFFRLMYSRPRDKYVVRKIKTHPKGLDQAIRGFY